MVLKQVGKPDTPTVDSTSVEEFATAIADKTHLANLISSLKSELASANALLKIKEKESKEAKEQLKRAKDDLNGTKKRLELLEKQCETYRQTVRMKNIFQIDFFTMNLIILCAFRSNTWRNNYRYIPIQSSGSRKLSQC